VGNQLWIEAEFPHGLLCLKIVGLVDGVGEQELRFELGTVPLHFHRNDHTQSHISEAAKLL